MKRPLAADNSANAQAVRQRAVASVACPKCGAAQGDACSATNGGRYDPRYTVHAARINLAIREAANVK